MVLAATPARAQGCDPDGTQDSGSKYRICMPPAGSYNGSLVIWAHGFQDAIESVKIPGDQLCFAGTCLPQLITSLGFGFATNSYSKTGLAVLQGKDDILDLVNIFANQKGVPNKVYLVGASEGGIITALSVEQRPDIYAGGVAACGPIGNFPYQINYFGDARATFEYFFPDLVPTNPFSPDPALGPVWADYYTAFVEPVIFHPDNRSKLDQWVRVASLPFDGGDAYLPTVRESARDVLRYAVVNLNDAKATLGGFPFDNRFRWYFGSDNDLLLNIFVQRVGAEPAAVNAMNTAYATTGVLQRPLVTLHTLRDQQVPYFHEVLYFLKTLSSGSFLTRHFNVAIDRFEHCNFTSDEALGAFAILLFYDGALQGVSGTAAQLTSAEQKAFENHMRAAGVPYRKSAAPLSFKLKN
jgi:pimeloyl-ACP methyl ester carboxylesterase